MYMFVHCVKIRPLEKLWDLVEALMIFNHFSSYSVAKSPEI